MHDPAERISATGAIQTGVGLGNVSPEFEPIHAAAIELVDQVDPTVGLYAYGSVVTGCAAVGTSDVDLLSIGLDVQTAARLGSELSMRFADRCRGVDITASRPRDFGAAVETERTIDPVGEGGLADEVYGNRVFLRHYCVRLAGDDRCTPSHEYPADRRAARGFNGDIGEHAARWRRDLELGTVEPHVLVSRVARKSLLAVTGLVSMHDRTWTTDRSRAATRWGNIEPQHRFALEQLLRWTTLAPAVDVDTVRRVLDDTIDPLVSTFAEHIGLWPAAR